MSRTVVIQSLKVLVSGLLIGFLLHRIGFDQVWDQLSRIQLPWILAAWALFSASHVIGSVQWWLIMRSEGIVMPWRQALSFYFVGLFFNNFLVSSMGGDLFRMVDVRRYSCNGSGAVSTVFLDRFMGLGVLTGLGGAAAIWMMLQGGVDQDFRLPLILVLGFWGLALLFCFSKSFARPFAWLIRRVMPHGITAKARDVYQKIHSFGRRRKLLVTVIGLSTCIQSARILTHYLVGRALGVTISPALFFLIIPIVAIMASLPISLGGVGLREQSGVVLFGNVGMLPQVAFSMEFIAYLVTIVSSLPGAMIFILRKRVGPANQINIVPPINGGDAQ